MKSAIPPIPPSGRYSHLVPRSPAIALLVLAMQSTVLFAQPLNGPAEAEGSRFDVIEQNGIYIVTLKPDGAYASYDELPAAVRLQRTAAITTVGDWPLSPATTFVVSDASDTPDPDLSDGTYSPPTLRSAIQNANSIAGSHAITFSSGLTIIQPASAFPSVNRPLTIDGSVAAGKIIIDGSLAPPNSAGLLLGGASTVRNMEFRNWTGGLGLALAPGAAGSVVQRNVFTLNRVGLNINGPNTLVGGTDPADRNLAYDNTQDGIDVVFADDVTIRNNFCGTSDGLTAAPNDNSGLYVLGARARVLDNVLSGNGGEGLEIGEYSVNTLVKDNIVGADSSRRARLGNGGDGISIFGDGDSVLNNVITDNGYGITVLSQAFGTFIHGNIIGPNGTLDSAFGNRYGGLQVIGAGVVIDSNIVSGNSNYGIRFSGYGGSFVRRNIVGTDPSGTLDWGNSAAGVFIVADTIIVGGPAPEDRNLISGNGGAGVELYGGPSFGGPRYFRGNLVQGNLIGTDIAGTAKIPNQHGILLTGYVDSNVVLDNVISGNERQGIWLRRASGVSANRTTFRANRIGTAVDGVTPLPNDSAGVLIDSAQANMFGGIDTSGANIVAFNGLGGFVVKAGMGTQILGNSIYKNGGLGIDLGNDGPTLNDSADADSGAHLLQNFPRLTWLAQAGGSTTVKGELRSLPGSDFRLEFYTSDEADTTGFGEGQSFQYTIDVHTDTGGLANFEFTIPGTFDRVSATATHAVYGTSEFSKSPFIVNSSADRAATNPTGGTASTSGPQVNGVPEVTLRSAIQASNHVLGGDEIYFNIPGPTPHFIQPASPFQQIFEDILIDATTQPGYAAGEVPPIRVSGASAGPLVDGLVLYGDRSELRALYISAFTADGVQMTGDRLSLTDVSAIANKGAGVRAWGDVALSGTSIFSSNGPSPDRSSIPCASTNWAGLWVGGFLTGSGEVSANGNCGNGIRLEVISETGDGSLTIEGTLNADGNSTDGLFADGDVTLRGKEFQFLSNGTPTNPGAGIHLSSGQLYIEATDTGGSPVIRANGNSGHGIWSGIGPITLKGKAQVNNNGAGVSEVRRFNNILTGLIAESDDIHINSIEAINNGYDGIKTGGSLFVEGDVTVKNHLGRGIWAIYNINLDGTNHLLENNLDQGMWAANGSIDVKGRLTARGNKLGGWHGGDEAPGISDPVVGAVLAYGNFTGEDVVIEDNAMSGLTAWKKLTIHGNAVIRRNAGRGVFAMNELAIHGTLHEISGNGGSGLSVNNGTVRVTGRLVADGNGADPDIVEEDGGEGIIGQWVEIQDASVRNNARHGIVGLSGIHVKGRGIITGNGGSGLASERYVSITGGRVCENVGYGILSPVVRISGTQVCQNGLGGVSGKVLPPPAFVTSPGGWILTTGLEAPSSSYIEGSSIDANTGDGIGLDTLLPFRVGASNIFGNTGFGVNNTGAGTLEAEGNWWGSAAGPGGQTSGTVQAASWLASAVSVYGGNSLDSFFVSAGEVDSMVVAVANWANPGDSISVSISDAGGWVTPVDSQTVVLSDSTAATMNVSYSIPLAAAGTVSRAIVSASSISTPGAAYADTLYFVVYEPAITEVTIPIDTLTAYPGDSLRLIAVAFDQAGREIPFVPVWNGTGGTITSEGVYVAGPDTGVYIVQVSDSASGLTDSAVVLIGYPIDTASPPAPSLSTNTLAVGDVGVGSADSVSFTLTNTAGDILRIDSIRTRTPNYSPVYFTDITQLRAGDTLEVAIVFAPDTLGTYLDTLEIFTNAAGPALAISLSGNGTVTGVGEEDSGIPATFVLKQNYPNPFNPTTTIAFELPVASRVTLRIYDVLVREVITLADGIVEAGYHRATWGGINRSGNSLSSGMYFYRIDAVGVADGRTRFTQVRKMIFLK